MTDDTQELYKAIVEMFSHLTLLQKQSVARLVMSIDDSPIIASHSYVIGLEHRNRRLATLKNEADDKVEKLQIKLDDYRCCNVKFIVCETCGGESEQWD